MKILKEIPSVQSMDCTELSDLEEGEILEYDYVPPSNSGGAHFGMRNLSLVELRKESNKEQFRLNQKKNLYPSQLNDGHHKQRLKEKLKPNEKSAGNNLIVSTIDLESISSDGEYRSDEENKHFSDGGKSFVRSNAENKAKGAFYGTVEDIMSEIGETICRKSRCNYKKRKSRDLKQNLDKCSATSYDLWRREIFLCRLKSRRHKRKGSVSDSNSDLPKDRVEKRKRKKKKREVRHEDETDVKKSKLRDFDEVRRNLLEKLKKQKAEQELKVSTIDSPLEAENSEIQEVDMLIDCTNYVDDVRITVPEGSTEEKERIKENEGEEETDLVKLRLIALASNKKRKAEEVTQKPEKSDGGTGGKNLLKSDRKDVDLDRNELLLRAEALKSALLKKHQKRLNRLKVKKQCEIGRSAATNLVDLASPPGEANVKNLNSANANEDALTAGEGARKKSDGAETESVTEAQTSCPEAEENETKEPVHQPSNVNGKRSLPKYKSKRKKSKSGSHGNDLKENNEKSETLEEDDRALRSQLLSDLMKKKSLKSVEKKSVLIDSVQTLANKSPPPAMADGPRTERAKPPAVQVNMPGKVNAAKPMKSVPLLKIPKPQIQRIIVHLGSEESSDEDEASPRAPEEASRQDPTSKRKIAEEKESKGSNIKEFSDFNKEAKMVRADYERSVELLLSQARKKIEGEKQTAKGTLATPEAVYKHLPPSQRLEYIRLKQKIAERERLKIRIRDGRKENSGVVPVGSIAAKPSIASGKESGESPCEKPTSGNLPKADPAPLKSPFEDSSSLQSVDSSSLVPSFRAARSLTSISESGGGLDSANGVRMKEPNHRLPSNKVKNNLVGFCGKGLKKSVAPPTNGLKAAVPVQRSTLLLPSSQALISKLKLLLKKIKVEKMIEENYGKEISKLRTQLSLFERKQSEQRFKIKKLGEESMKTYKAIQGITAKSNEKATRKDNEAKGKEDGGVREEKEEGKNVSDEPVTEITKGQGKGDKEANGDDKVNETGAGATASDPCLMEYTSPLQIFNKVADSSERVDPNVMICQFDLLGVCKDEECAYQHLRNS